MEKYKIGNKVDCYFECNYASEDPDFKIIPAGYINKTVCGCGLTSVAIESTENTIIAVPNVSLVTNKLKQYNNDQLPKETDGITFEASERFSGLILGIYGGVEYKDIQEYVKKVEKAGTPIKILVTYDSLSKCEYLLGKCHLIIDESDKLISYMAMKVNSKKLEQPMDVVTSLFETAKKFKESVSFISATPIDVSYLPDWVSDLDQITLHWKNTHKVIPITMQRKFPFNALEEEIIRPLKKNKSIELGGSKISKVIVFINSVDSIVKIVRECNLTKEEVAILCGDNSRNSFKIRGYNTIDNPKKLPKYTFITSSGFQGIDLIDKEAINVVVSYTGKDYQMVDLNTDLIQATSRQRDRSNPNYERFVYIYDQSPFDEKTQEELISEMNKIHDRIVDNCKTLKELHHKEDSKREFESAATTFSQSEDFRRYTAFVNGEFNINEIVFNAEKYQILETKRRYAEGFDIIADYVGDSPIKPIVILEPKQSKKLSYISIMYKYKDLIKKAQNEEESSESEEGSRREVDRSKFDEEELNSKNFQIVDSYYKLYGKFTTNATYARRMARVIGAEEDQFRVDMQSIFLEEGDYIKSALEDDIAKVYRKYNIEKRAKANDLIEFGYKIRTKKIKGYPWVEIQELPKID